MSVETNGTLTNTTVSIAANKDRRGLVVGNNSDTAMTVRLKGATASATAGLPLPAGDTMWLTPEMTGTEAVSVFCAGTAKAYTIYEW